MNPELPPEPQKIITSEDIPKSVSNAETAPTAEETPQKFTRGQEVTVKRSGKNGAPASLEAGWIVDSVDSENGIVVAFSPDGQFEKTISIDVLESIQPKEDRFEVNQIVTVKRNAYDAAGNRIKGQSSYEAGWHVRAINEEADTVTVASADGQLEKTFSVSALKSFQETSEAPVSVERTAEAAFRQKAQQDLGEEAVEAVEEGIADSAAIAAGRILSLENREVKHDEFSYLRTELPPVVRPPKTSAPSNYDRLLSGDTADQPWQQGRGFGHYEAETEEDKQRKYYDRFVTEENRENALGTLQESMKATPEIREVLALFNIQPDSMDAVDAIRENPEVRFEVAKILVQKLDRLADDPHNDLGWRITQNSPNNLKVNPQTGKRMLSRLYAVDMALKMIDGEFSSKHEGTDPIDRDESGKVAIGQHRHAASSTLMTYI